MARGQRRVERARIDMSHEEDILVTLNVLLNDFDTSFEIDHRIFPGSRPRENHVQARSRVSAGSRDTNVKHLDVS